MLAVVVDTNVIVSALLKPQSKPELVLRLFFSDYAQRIRLDFERAARQNLNRLLDKPGYLYRKYLLGGGSRRIREVNYKAITVPVKS